MLITMTVAGPPIVVVSRDQSMDGNRCGSERRMRPAALISGTDGDSMLPSPMRRRISILPVAAGRRADRKATVKR